MADIRAGVLLSLKDQYSEQIGEVAKAIPTFTISAALADISAGAGGSTKQIIDLEELIARLGIQSGSTAERMNELKREIFQVTQQPHIKVSPDELLGATGDLEFAQDNLNTIGVAIQAIGAIGSNRGALLPVTPKGIGSQESTAAGALPVYVTNWGEAVGTIGQSGEEREILVTAEEILAPLPLSAAPKAPALGVVTGALEVATALLDEEKTKEEKQVAIAQGAAGALPVYVTNWGEAAGTIGQSGEEREILVTAEEILAPLPLSAAQKAPALGVVTGALEVATALLDEEKTKEEKQVAVVQGAAGTAGALGGAKLGALLGGAIGSIVPVVGTAIGAALGGTLGAGIGYSASRFAAGNIVNTVQEREARGREAFEARQEEIREQRLMIDMNVNSIDEHLIVEPLRVHTPNPNTDISVDTGNPLMSYGGPL